MPWNVWNLTQGRWALLKSVPSRKRATAAITDFLAKQHRGDVLEVRKVRPLMEAHGTKVAQLKPSLLWNLAMEDLKRVERNRLAEHGYYERYHFHRAHVRKAVTANDILRAAAAEIELGRASEKAGTRLLYADPELLRAALK